MSLSADAPPLPNAGRRWKAQSRVAALVAGDALAWIGGFTAAAWTRYEFDLTTVSSSRSSAPD